jgi:cell division protein FtsN
VVTKHVMLTFRLHRKGVVLIAFGCLVLAVLLFGGGYLAGIQRGRAVALKKPSLPKIVGPKLPVRKGPAPPPTAATSTAPAAAPVAPAETFSILTGAFASEEEAKVLVARLAARKLEAAVDARVTSEGTRFYVVMAGRYSSRSAAAAAASAIEQEEGVGTAIITLPPPAAHRAGRADSL